MAGGHGQLRECATHALLPEGELRCRAGAERVTDGPAHQPTDEQRIQTPPRPGSQDPARYDTPMRCNHQSPQRARDRGVMRGSQPTRRDRRVRVGEALFRSVMQDIHPALAIRPSHAGWTAALPVLRRRCRPLRRLRWQGRHPARAIGLPRPALRPVRCLRRRPVGDAQRQRFRLAGKVAVARRVVVRRAGMQAQRCGPG